MKGPLSRRGALALRVFALAALLFGCADRKGEGDQCAFNDDCTDPLVCAGTRCRAQCRTDRDCPAGSHCASGGEPSKRVCLPPQAELLCAAESDCPAGAACFARSIGGACRWRCATDRDCDQRSIGAVCSLAERLCAPPILVRERNAAIDADAAAPTDAAAPDVTAEDASAPDAPPTDVGMDVVEAGVDVVEAGMDVVEAGMDVVEAGMDVVVSCRAEESLCGGRCVDVRTSLAHCGDCDRPCAAGAGVAAAACVAGRCAVGQCVGGRGDCDGDPANGCEVSLNASAQHCGTCGNACSAMRPPHVAVMGCAARACVIERCEAGYADCNRELGDGCEVRVSDDPARCGACLNDCGSGRACVRGVCTDLGPLAPDTTNEGDFDPSAPQVGDAGVDAGPDVRVDAGAPSQTVVIPSGVHTYRSFTLPAGYVLRVSGTGVLDLRVLGDVRIDGTIDLNGGRGGNGYSGGVSGSTPGVCNPYTGCAGGGSTGTGVGGADGRAGTCAAPGGGGALNAGVGGSVGGFYASCGGGGRAGGGTGGMGVVEFPNYFTGGAGGGGYAGGGGGAGTHPEGTSAAGAAGASVLTLGTGGGGGVWMSVAGGGGEPSLLRTPEAMYAGRSADMPAGCNAPGGGGGGSIGLAAVRDLAVRTTFYPGSGGGGGGARFFTNSCQYGLITSHGGGGGGGGGGALRIVSRTRIELGPTGRLLASGGNGGNPAGFTAAGGGGSGGVVYLAAPTLRALGEIRVDGGITPTVPGAQCFGTGGNGGVGRIRLSALDEPGRCEVNGARWSVIPAGGATSCAPTTGNGTPGRAFIGVYPD